MSRSFHKFDCEGEQLVGTMDDGPQSTGLLIVSGGNEIRSGAHSGMAKLAETLSNHGFPVFRYDRRGIGDSNGENTEFLNTEADIAAAIKCFREANSNVKKVAGFGNCDAATALAMFSSSANLGALILANPWVIENAASQADKATTPPPSAIRARYWERLKNPRTILDLFRGKIDFKKLLHGIKQASQKQENTGLSIQLRDAMTAIKSPCRVLLAKRDTTALAFQAAWNSADFNSVKTMPNIVVKSLDSASHSFADDNAKNWLETQIVEMLESV